MQKFETIGDDVGSIVEIACIATAAYMVVSVEKRSWSDVGLFVASVFLCALIYYLLARLIVPPDFFQRQQSEVAQREQKEVVAKAGNSP